MRPYPKIQSVFKRDPADNYKTFIEGDFTLPVFEYLRKNIWILTEKIDGTNIRVQWDAVSGTVNFKGRKDTSQIPDFLLDKLKDMFPVEKFKEIYPDMSMCLYGEGYGNRIQGSGKNYIPDGVSFVLFDVMVMGSEYVDGGIWLDWDNVVDVSTKMGIRVVPVVEYGTLDYAIELVRDGHRGPNSGSVLKSKWGDFPAEGLVCRPKEFLLDRRGRRVITKIKVKDFKQNR